jgi:hypothetical protein
MRLQLLRLVLLTGTGLFVFIVGCAPGLRRIPETGATLEGTIKYGSEKVPVAMVIVAGEGSGGAQGFVGDDGRYKVENVPLGEVKIGVSVKAGEGQMMSRRMSGQKVPRSVAVPDKYEDPEKSGIKTTTAQGANTFDIVIPK